MAHGTVYVRICHIRFGTAELHQFPTIWLTYNNKVQGMINYDKVTLECHLTAYLKIFYAILLTLFSLYRVVLHAYSASEQASINNRRNKESTITRDYAVLKTVAGDRSCKRCDRCWMGHVLQQSRPVKHWCLCCRRHMNAIGHVQYSSCTPKNGCTNKPFSMIISWKWLPPIQKWTFSVMSFLIFNVLEWYKGTTAGCLIFTYWITWLRSWMVITKIWYIHYVCGKILSQKPKYVNFKKELSFLFHWGDNLLW